MTELSYSADFERDALPHLNSVYNLARRLMRNDQDAQDLVQEAYLRAFRSYHRFRGGDARPWLLKIVRNACYTCLRQQSVREPVDFDQNCIPIEARFDHPEEMLAREDNRALLGKALDALPPYCREVLILRELEQMSYSDISTVIGVPIGTVMSRLSRARTQLRESVSNLMNVRPGTRAD